MITKISNHKSQTIKSTQAGKGDQGFYKATPFYIEEKDARRHLDRERGTAMLLSFREEAFNCIYDAGFILKGTDHSVLYLSIFVDENGGRGILYPVLFSYF